MWFQVFGPERKTGPYDVLGCRISFWGPKGLLVQPVAVTQCYAPVVSPVRSSSPARLGAACVMFVRSFFGWCGQSCELVCWAE